MCRWIFSIATWQKYLVSSRIATAGRIEIVYQPGHPHGFVTSIYMAEIAHCRVLWDPTGALAALKAKTGPYPAALRQATIAKFWWEVFFSLSVAHKATARGDATL